MTRVGPRFEGGKGSMRMDSLPAGPTLVLRVGSIATVIATYALVVLGSTVRVTESGMGCSSWPLCNGKIGPLDNYHAVLEQTHRYLAAAVTIGVFAVLAAARRARAGRRVLVPALAAAGMVAVQVVLGAITVFAGNAGWTVALHLVGALLLLAAVVVTAVGILVAEGSPGRVDGLVWWAAGSAFLLFVSGTIVVDGGASAACQTWPWCTASAGLGWKLPIVQLVHRTMAAVAGTLIVILAARTVRRRSDGQAARALAWSLIALLPVQIAAGAVSAVLAAPAWAQDIHLAVGTAIWGCVVALADSVYLAAGLHVGARGPLASARG